jgi:LmbE family N-acetylglucosaminyl deacetylase
VISIGFTPEQPLRRVLAIGAHSDDVEIGCGGLMLELAERFAAAEFTWIVATGDKARQAEAGASAAAFFPDGRQPMVVHGGLRDGYLPYEPAGTKDFMRTAVADLRPDLVLTHNRDDLHQDHRFLGELGLQLFRGELVLEYEIPKYDGDLGRPNLYSALSDEVAEYKIAHLMRHFASQRGKRWFNRELFDGLMRVRGMEAGAPAGRAEAFYCRKAILG